MDRPPGWKPGIWARIFLGPVMGCLVGGVAFVSGLNSPMSKTLGVAAFMITWWIEGSIKMGLTGLLPIVLLPCLGILTGGQVSKVYFSDSVMVCMGSLLMAQAVELYDLHRIAASYLLRYSSKYGAVGVVFCFVFISGFLSMWLSNTATAALMIPLANAVCSSLTADLQGIPVAKVGAAVDLAIAFGSGLGGMATLTGTGSNLVLQGTMVTTFGTEGTDLTFLTWFAIGVPLAVVNLLLLWGILSMFLLSDALGSRLQALCNRARQPATSTLPMYSLTSGESTRNVLASAEELSDDEEESKGHRHRPKREEEQASAKIPADGGEGQHTDQNQQGGRRLSYAAWVVLIDFVAMALLWMTRDPPGDWGWARLMGSQGDVTDGTVAIGCCLLLFVLPAEPPPALVSVRRHLRRWRAGGGEYSPQNDLEDPVGDSPAPRKHVSVLPWTAMAHLHWDIIFLLGGGLALSLGFQESGLSDWLASIIGSMGLQDVNILTCLAAVTACAVTNVMSNIAAANVFLPLLACVGPQYHRDPLYVLFPVTCALSLAFLLPLGTPPNAIVVSNNRVSVMLLFKVGSVCTVVFMTSLLVYSVCVLPLIYGHKQISQSLLDSCGV